MKNRKRKIKNFCNVDDSACRSAFIFYGLILLLVSLFLLPYTTSAQQYTFIQYSLKEGLAQSQVRCIMQDSRGYIWAGTLGGLSRFDGEQFYNYDKQSGLLNNQINCAIELNEGTIAVGSNGNIAFINGLGVKSIALPEPFNEEVVNTLFEDKQQQLWIGTENGIHIYSLASGAFLEQNKQLNELNKAHIKSIIQTKQNQLILSKEKLFKITEQGAEVLFAPENKETSFFDIVETKDQHLWIATRGEALLELSPEGSLIKGYSGAAHLNADILTNIVATESGPLYMTSRFGFYKYDYEKFSSFAEREGLPTSDIRDVLEDKEGNIWLATYGNGILKFTGEAFTSYTTADGLIGDAVMSIMQDTQNHYWISTFDKGICKMIDDTIKLYDLKNITEVNRIWSSLCDHEGNLWFASSDGLFNFSKGTFKTYTSTDSLPADVVLSLYEDQSGKLWVGTSKGLAVRENGTFKNITDSQAPRKRIRCIRQDKAGNMWFATNEGVYNYNGEKFTAYSQKDGLPDNSTNCIEIDEYNRIWVGTMSGLSVLRGNQFFAQEIYNTPGSNVINFLKYHHNTLWIGTNNGLHSALLDAQTNEQELIFNHYGLEEGLRSLETNLNAVMVDHNNYIWFGTTEGVTKINTSLLTKPKGQFAPLLTLSNIQINLQDQNWTKLSAQIDAMNGLAINPKLSYKNNHLTFYFTGISTTYPNQVQYQYMLEGLDDDWKPLTKSRFATYSNLPYKHFTFKVRALSKMGIWSEPITYSFSIVPPFWLRWWFIALEIIAALGIVGAIAYSRNKAQKAKREKEWFEIRSKMLVLEQQSLNSSMNRHFIFNALNSIQYYINRQDKLAANRYLSDFAKLIRKNLDSSQDNLTTLRDEIERLELYLKLEHMRFKDKFEYSINVDPTLNLDLTKVPAMLVQPFLENSIWHGLLPSEKQGMVRIDIAKARGHIEFIITDNGVGIENSLKNKSGTDNHISKGMQITQNRIDLIKKTTGQTIELRGPYQFEANADHPTGTRVEIIVPENFHELFST
jgi:ligand-binding sensor domain-containing protein